jgi:hypothetical protein
MAKGKDRVNLGQYVTSSEYYRMITELQAELGGTIQDVIQEIIRRQWRQLCKNKRVGIIH